MCFNATKSYKILMLRPDVTSGFVVETQHYFTCKFETYTCNNAFRAL